MFQTFARYGAVLATGLEWLSWAWFYALRPDDWALSRPISYFATVPDTRWIFMALYVAAALSFWIFSRAHVVGISRAAHRSFGISMAAFAAVAAIPYNPDEPLSAGLHMTAFAITAVAFNTGMLLVALALHPPRWRWGLLGLTALSVLALCGVGFFPDGPYVLVFELGWWIPCQVWMIAMSVYVWRSRRTTS